MTRVSDERPKQKLKTDVLVVGGGAAGLAAACTAAKAGARVLLLEKYGFCGGAAVAGLSGRYAAYTPPRTTGLPRPKKSYSVLPTAFSM